MARMDYLPALAAFIVSAASSLAFLSAHGRRLLLDHPNERSLHHRPVPRGGGIGIIAGAAVGASLAPAGIEASLWIAVGLAAVSLVDDWAALPVALRLCAHLAAAAGLLVLEAGGAPLGLLLLLLLAVAWSTNLFNFMDGSDGLAGGMALVGFSAYAWAAHQSGHAGLSIASASIAAAAAGFLLFNFPPARLFMGDVGSVPLGFLGAALGIVGWHQEAWPFWFPALVFAPFCCDASVTLIKRLLGGERVWKAHRDHYYQRLVRMGFGHRGTLMVEYGAMLACAWAALAAREAPAAIQVTAIAACGLALGGSAIWIDGRWAKFRDQSPGSAA